MPLKPKYFQAPESSGRERWMISYTDVMTILLILFVAVAARSVQVSKNPPPVAGVASNPLRKAQETLERKGLHPRLEARGLVVSLPQAVLFASGEDTISPAALPTVAEIAAVMAELPNRIILAGYSDAVPIHNQRFRSNWELSSARGVALLRVLTENYGIDETRLSVASYGSHAPLTSNETDAGRAENRRVEIVIEGI